MAERFPRYRPLGASLQQIGNVSYAQAGSARARAMSNIGTALDRAIEFALEERAEDALQYAVENAPTEKQIRDALKTPELLAGPKDGAINKNAWAQVMYSRMQAAASADLIETAKSAEIRGDDLKTLSDNSNAQIKGYSSLIKEVDPSLALKFEAVMANQGNALLRAHASREVAANADIDKKTELADIENIRDTIPSIVQAGPSVGADGTVVSTRKQFEEVASRVFAKTEISPEQAASAYKGLEQGFIAAQNAKVAAWIMEDPVKHLEQFRSGEGQPEWLKADIAEMPVGQKLEMRISVNATIRDQLSTEAAFETNFERKRASKSLEIQAELAQVAGDDDAEAALMDKLLEADPAAWTSRTEALQKSGGVDVAQTVSFLDRELAAGTLQYADVYEAQANGNITTATARRLTNGISAKTDKRFNTAMDYAKSTLGFPDRSIINPSATDRRAQQQVASIKAKLILARDADPSIDSLAFVQNEIDNVISAENKKKIARLKKQMDDIAKKPIFKMNMQAGKEYDPLILKQNIQEAVDRGSYSQSAADSDISIINDYLGYE